MNPTPGGLTLHIADRETRVEMTGGDGWTLPVGPWSLVDGQLERADRPSPIQLTNALGIVQDHFDDVILAAPIVADSPSLWASGVHATAFARVESGERDVAAPFVVERASADEVFRTLVAETIAERRDNPGLDAEHVESIIGTCCVILAVIRRLDLQHVTIASTSIRPTEALGS